jgi:NLR family CARD domain-containing protein 3
MKFVADYIQIPSETIYDLAFAGSQISREAFRMMADALERNNTVRQLVLSDTAFETETLLCLVHALRLNTSLRVMCLSNRWKPAVVAETAVEMLQIDKSPITHLVLEYSNLGDNELVKISDSLKANKTVESVKFAKNCFSPVGAVYFCKAILCHPTLKEIDLSNNDIESDGIRAVADVLREGALETVKLNECGGKAAGVQAIAVAMKHNTSLSHLEISGFAGSPACIELIHAVIFNPSLVKLRLRGTAVNDSAASAIVELINTCATLRLLDLSDNGITDAGAEKICAALENSKLTSLSLCNNAITPYKRKQLQKRFKAQLVMTYVSN